MQGVATAIDSYRKMLRDQIGPLLRSSGFTGSASTWVRSAATGDRVVVNAQSSSSSSANEVRFAINLAAVPLPWWKWHSHEIGGDLDRAVKEHDGLYRDRLRPSAQYAGGPDQTWWSVTDAASAQRAGADVARALDQDGLPILLRLLDRREMLEAARRGALGFGLRDVREAVAVLLTAEAPSRELAALLDELEVLEDARLRSKYRPLVDWCRATIQTATD